MVKKVKSVEKTKSLEPTKKLNKVEKTKSSEIVKAKKIKEKLSKDKVIKEKVEKTAKKKKVKNEVKETNQPTGKLPSTDGSELVSSIVVKKGVDALKAATEKTQASNGKEDLFSSEHRYGLQVIATKIPKIPSHNRKILLKNSLYLDEEPDILFIFRDKSKKDQTVAEMEADFKELLTSNGITCVKNVITLSTLKKDYAPHNMKLKLLNTYDIFLVEPEIAEHTYSFLGKHFITKRKRPLQIDTKNTEKMKMSIANAINKVSFKLNSQSNFSVIEVGTHKMENEKIVENVMTTLEQLKEKWPGGWKNILRLYLKPMMPSKVSIPIFYSETDPNDVEIPQEVGPKQQRRNKISQKLQNKSKRLRFDVKTKKITKEKVSSANINKQMMEKKNEKKLDKMKKKNEKLKKNAN